MNKKDNKISELHEFFDGDPTDRLSALTEAQALAAESPATPESDRIPTLLKSQALAVGPADRDTNGLAADEREALIERLQRDIGDQRLLISTLQEELSSVEQENAQLRDNAAAINQELTEKLARINGFKESQLALKEELARAEEDLAVACHHAALGAEPDEPTLSDDEDLAAYRQEIHELKSQLQDLETYVDARKAEWHRVEQGSESQNAALESLRQQLQDKERQVRELTRNNDELQAELSQRCSETETLNATLAAGHDVVQNVTRQLYDTQEQLDSLTAHRQSIDELVAELETERVRSAETRRELEQLRGEADSTEERVESRIAEITERALQAEERCTQLEAARKEELTELQRTRDELRSIAAMRDQLVVDIRQRELELSALNSRVDELEAERHQTVEALTTQRQIIQHMKDELRSKLDAIAVIAQNHEAQSRASVHSASLSLAGRVAGVEAPESQEAARMLVTLDGDQTLKYPICKDSMTIGRSADNDIRIRRQFISRHHARIETDVDGATIFDLGSKNGVMVNSVRVEQQRLRDGDLVDFGEMKLRFVDLLTSGPPETS